MVPQKVLLPKTKNDTEGRFSSTKSTVPIVSLLSEFYADHAAVGDEVLEGGAESGFADVDVGAGKYASVGKDEDVLVVFLLEFVQEFRYAVVHLAE